MGKRRTTRGKGITILLFALASAFLIYGCGGGGTASQDAPPGSEGGEDGSAQSPAREVGEKIAAPGGSYTRVSPAELRGTLRGGDLLLVNTHVPFAGNLPGTDLSIPYDRVSNTDRLPADRDARIAVYCRSGSMSASASETLVRIGYENVWDLKGGMVAWEGAGFPLEGA